MASRATAPAPSRSAERTRAAARPPDRRVSPRRPPRESTAGTRDARSACCLPATRATRGRHSGCRLPRPVRPHQQQGEKGRCRQHRDIWSSSRATASWHPRRLVYHNSCGAGSGPVNLEKQPVVVARGSPRLVTGIGASWHAALNVGRCHLGPPVYLQDAG